jgi:hypothetical protein
LFSDDLMISPIPLCRLSGTVPATATDVAALKLPEIQTIRGGAAVTPHRTVNAKPTGGPMEIILSLDPPTWLISVIG